jgi:hypothetical protein
MNEAVSDVVGAAAVKALPLGLAPGRSGTDFVDHAHAPESSCLPPDALGDLLRIFFEISRKFRKPPSTVSAAQAHFKRCIFGSCAGRQESLI